MKSDMIRVNKAPRTPPIMAANGGFTAEELPESIYPVGVLKK